MPDHKGHDRITELIASLTMAMGRLQKGQLGLEELEQSTTEARLLYERLVVLRHKLREGAVGHAVKTAKPVPDPAVPGPEPVPIRLDTRPPEAPVHQTSLIDAIAETEATVTPPPKAVPVAKPRPASPAKQARAEADRPLTVADRMEHAPVADLRKAIALSQKFWFVAELFGGDRARYEAAIDVLNAAEGFDAAREWMQKEVLAPLPAPPGDVAETFTELLRRRFRA
jgi:hypothetical protein